MIKFKGFVIYFNTLAWGWQMCGIGWKAKWFLGFSKNVQVDIPNVSDKVN
jgi:hypothetical protein